MNAIRGATLAITVFCIPNLFMFGEFAMSSKLIVALLAVIGVLLIAVVILLATVLQQRPVSQGLDGLNNAAKTQAVSTSAIPAMLTQTADALLANATAESQPIKGTP